MKYFLLRFLVTYPVMIVFLHWTELRLNDWELWVYTVLLAIALSGWSIIDENERTREKARHRSSD